MGRFKERSFLSPIDRDDYPEKPGFRRDGTSRDAAAAIAPAAASLRAKALAIIVAAPDGLTTDQVAERMGKQPWQMRPRVSELLRRRKIIETPERRKGQSGLWIAVWKAAPSEGC